MNWRFSITAFVGGALMTFGIAVGSVWLAALGGLFLGFIFAASVIKEGP